MQNRTDYAVTMGRPEHPGAWSEGNRVGFTVELPEGAEAELLLYREGEELPCQEIPLPEEKRIGLAASVCVEIPAEERLEYNYRVNGHVVSDPCASGIRKTHFRHAGSSSRKGEGTREEVDREEIRCVWQKNYGVKTCLPVIPYEDCIFYKANVRGLTMEKPAGVRHPGTFLGLQEFIPYLKNLGINSLILMPLYEFTEEPSQTESFYLLDDSVKVMQPSGGDQKKNYWGYAEGLYYAPKLSYSATGNPQKEFADLIDALHLAGIQLLPEFYFSPEAGGRQVTDVLRHWLLTYRIDGFHLVGQGDWISTVRTDPLLKKSRILYTDFPASVRELRSKKPQFRNLGIYNLSFEQAMRRFLKGDPDCSPEEIAGLLRRNDSGCGYLNFMADQDGFTMADMVSYGEKHNEENGQNNRDGFDCNYSWNCGEEGPSRKKAVRILRRQQLRNAFLLVMTGQGSPVIYSGDEVLNSQGGNNNAWCQDNTTGWVSWKKSRDTEEMLAFVKKCIGFRKEHPVLRQRQPLRMADYKKTGYPDISYHSHTAWMYESGQTKAGIAVMYSGGYAEKSPGVPDDTIYIAYNMYWRPQFFAVPDLLDGKQWYIKADTFSEEGFYEGDGIVLEKTEGEGKVFEVPPRTVIILVGK